MTRILFLFPENSSLGPMAHGLARHILGDRVELIRAGSPQVEIHAQAARAMEEIGIDINHLQTQSADSIDTSNIDFVITLGTQSEDPILPGHVKRLIWSIASPDQMEPGLSQEVIQQRFSATREQLKMRIEILGSLLDLPKGPESKEFHGSIRVNNLPQSVRFYAWLLNTWPKSWTHRSVTFIRSDLNLNFVLLVSDDKPLHQDTLYHLGIDVSNRQAVIDTYHKAVAFGCTIEKPPRTTWRGTPLHELWLKDPDGTLIEVYSRLSEEELKEKPSDEQPVFLIAGSKL